MSRYQYINGALAGTVATLFHTAVMWALHPRLPRARQQPLPPTQITAVVAARAGVETAQAGPGLTAATVASHFGYGAAAGALYPLWRGRQSRAQLLSGVGFGVGVWAASYLGWIPALRILPPATKQPAQRNVMMILAHVAWGAALAAVFSRLDRARKA
jgi:uncharacterized membrane protein YagU involved in acid resistance